MSTRIPRAVLALLLSAPAVLADTITVGPGGSGADFTELPPAVAFAQPGDTVLIAPGDYPDVGTVVVDKALTILGAGSDQTTVIAAAASPIDSPLPIHVTGIGPGEEVRIVGLTLVSGALAGVTSAAVVVDDCEGPVVLADVAASGGPSLFFASPMVRVTDSARVTLDGCRFEVTPSIQNDPTPALLVTGSSVIVSACELVGGSAGLLSSGQTPRDGAPGIEAEGALVRVSRSTVTGGSGTASTPFGTPEAETSGAPAILATSSTLFVRGGGTAVRGGNGGTGLVGGTPLSGPGGAALELSIDSLATTTPDVALLPGADGNGTLPAPTVEGPGAWVPLADSLATLGATTTVVARGDTAGFVRSGAAGSTYLTWLAFGQGPELSLPGFLGALVLPIGQSIRLANATLDAAGQAPLDIAVPNIPSLAGTTLLFQGLALAPSGELSFSNPAFLGIL